MPWLVFIILSDLNKQNVHFTLLYIIHKQTLYMLCKVEEENCHQTECKHETNFFNEKTFTGVYFGKCDLRTDIIVPANMHI